MNNFDNLKVKSLYHIEQIFPDTIYVTKDVCNYLLPSLEKSAKKIAEEKGTLKSPSLWVNSTHRTASFEIKKIHPFDILSNYIKYHTFNYLREMGYVNYNKLHIINMWFNISDEGDFNFPHSHPGSFLSGVFYIKAPPKTTIQFYDTKRMIGNMLPADNMNYLSYDMLSYQCITGSMMIWNSNFVHGNPRQMTPGEKIAVSFNIDVDKKYDD